MRKLLRRPSLACLLLAAPLAATAALQPADWRHRQDFTVAAPGLVRVAPTPATFDGGEADQRDWRVVDADGREQAYLLTIEREHRPEPQRAAQVTTRLHGNFSQTTIATGIDGPLAVLRIETPARLFLKAANVEISDDGETWTTIDRGLPLFRQAGAENLRVDLQGRRAAYVRLELDDFRSPALTITSVWLEPAAGEPAALQPVETRLVRREAFAGETVLTVALPGRHVPLARLDFTTPEPLFTRQVTVAERELRDGEASERIVARGTIYRVQLPGVPPREQLSLPLDFAPTTRELLVHIHDGDSPPLQPTAVQAWQPPAALVFAAPAAGDYAVLTGHAQARTPRYDLAALGQDLRRAEAVALTLGERRANPGHRPPDTLPEASATGGAFDATGWTHVRTVTLTASGVQELELDVPALAAARADFADLRLARDGKQVPYLLERPALARQLELALTPATDARRPAVGRWTIALPHARLPLRALVFRSPDPLFQRTLRVHETITTRRGDTYERALGQATWTRTPDTAATDTFTLALETAPETKLLTLEIDNGDNPPLQLGALQATYPVVRLVFKGQAGETLTLHAGKPGATAPRYDLALVGRQLLAADRHPARLADAATPATDRAAPLLASLRGGVAFWIALAVVVVVLLVVVAKLLPKPPAA
ncbi:MAG: hypothetical protein KBC32_00050 [Candidatus Didemnitutus sp.]|nr:hypothetical protein [Candidatus Didemnitutus sp.]